MYSKKENNFYNIILVTLIRLAFYLLLTSFDSKTWFVIYDIKENLHTLRFQMDEMLCQNVSFKRPKII